LNKGKLIVLSGPSGAGKSTVVGKAMEGRNDICFSVSATTRKPRPGEVDGRDYFFVDRESFEKMIEGGELLEHAEYVGNYYGTPRAFVDRKLSEGMNVILDIEIQGARKVSASAPEAIKIFMTPPSIENLRTRLEGRGTDSAEVIAARIERARQEYKEADFYDYLIINDDADTAAKELSAIILAESCRFNGRKEILTK